jgi:hypothetical protein
MGVYWDKQNKKWKASLLHNNKRIYIGCFKNEKNAVKAVNWKCKELKIPIKNPEVVGVLDNDQLKKLKQKVITFYLFLCYFIFFWVRDHCFKNEILCIGSRLIFG